MKMAAVSFLRHPFIRLLIPSGTRAPKKISASLATIHNISIGPVGQLGTADRRWPGVRPKGLRDLGPRPVERYAHPPATGLSFRVARADRTQSRVLDGLNKWERHDF